MKKFNLPLLIGALLLVPFVAAAAAPYALAPRNPTTFNQIVEIGARFVPAPFPAFQSPDFPLGSDALGRDTLSRLIHAIRPTLLMVAAIALCRVALGMLIGVVNGWSNGAAGRAASWLISAASAVPSLLIAFGVIALLHAQLGAAAFVIGLVLTGWADIAAFCAAQTRLIKQERFIEAAQSLGVPGWQIALRHVVRQLTPHLRSYAIIEAGGALIAIASLGLLGYFANGANWFMVTDFEAQRLSGRPDLAEMLASAVQTRNAEQMLIIGAVLIALIGALNLIGEGLRRGLAAERKRRGAVYRGVTDFVQTQQDRLSEAMAQRRTRRVIIGLGGVALFAAACTVAANQALQTPPPALVPALGGHQWSSDRHDSLGTLRAATRLNASTKPVVQWEKVLANELSGSPAVAADGTIYVASRDKRLHALTPGGELIWSALLDFVPVGAPGLTASGEIAVADDQGGLTTFDAQGNGRWGYRPTQARRAISGPVFDADGNAYLAQDGYLVSVDPRGGERWTSRLPYTYFSPVPRTDGRFVFFKDLVFSARTGKVLVAESPDDLDQFVTGADGKLYLMSQSRLLEWQASADSAALAAVRNYDWTKRYPSGNPADATIWSDGSTWLLLTTGTNDSRLIWVNPQGEVAGSVELPLFGGRIIGIGEDGIVYVCGEVSGREARCDAVQPGTDKPLWTQMLPVEPFIGEYREQPMVIGGALLPDKLLVSTLSGKLYALSDPAVPVAAASSPTPALVPVTPAVPQPALDPAAPTIAVAIGATVIVSEPQGFFPVEPTVALPTPFPTLALTISPDASPEPVIDATAVLTDAVPAPTTDGVETAIPTPAGVGLDPQACEVSKATVLRQVPSPIGTELASLSVGAKVSLLSRERDNAWAYVRAGRRVGWVLVADTQCGG